MGFSFMVCGLGAYPAAMLHLVAHSFYKAHAFLSSGSVIDLIRASKVTRTSRSVSPLKVVSGIAMALTLYTGFALIWGVDPVNEFALLVVGAVIVLGLARLFTSALMVKSGALLLQTSLLSLMVTVAFFTLESSARYLLANQVPTLALPGWGKIIAAGLLLLAFGLVVFIQIIAPQLTPNPYYRSLAIHVRNGFYANALFDRLVGALSIHTTARQREKKELQEQLV
jgi:NAD(P)H-quinone oxidoreductase subunit 5